ncbi:unnamed protein product, partial [Pleuronectes platessa]
GLVMGLFSAPSLPFQTAQDGGFLHYTLQAVTPVLTLRCLCLSLMAHPPCVSRYGLKLQHFLEWLLVNVFTAVLHVEPRLGSIGLGGARSADSLGGEAEEEEGGRELCLHSKQVNLRKAVLDRNPLWPVTQKVRPPLNYTLECVEWDLHGIAPPPSRRRRSGGGGDRGKLRAIAPSSARAHWVMSSGCWLHVSGSLLVDVSVFVYADSLSCIARLAEEEEEGGRELRLITFVAPGGAVPPSPSSPRRRRLSVRHREVLIRWHLKASLVGGLFRGAVSIAGAEGGPLEGTGYAVSGGHSGRVSGPSCQTLRCASAGAYQLTENWCGPGESDCLIKTSIAKGHGGLGKCGVRKTACHVSCGGLSPSDRVSACGPVFSESGCLGMQHKARVQEGVKPLRGKRVGSAQSARGIQLGGQGTAMQVWEDLLAGPLPGAGWPPAGCISSVAVRRNRF